MEEPGAQRLGWGRLWRRAPLIVRVLALLRGSALLERDWNANGAAPTGSHGDDAVAVRVAAYVYPSSAVSFAGHASPRRSPPNTPNGRRRHRVLAARIHTSSPGSSNPEGRDLDRLHGLLFLNLPPRRR